MNKVSCVQRSVVGLNNGAMDWTFFTNHARVLLLVATDTSVRIREIAHKVGITERAVQRILQELEADGYVFIEKTGRRNQYMVRMEKPLRHRLESQCTVADLLKLHRKCSEGALVPSPQEIEPEE